MRERGREREGERGREGERERERERERDRYPLKRFSDVFRRYRKRSMA